MELTNGERIRNAVTPTAVVVALFLTWLSIFATRDQYGTSKLSVGFILAVIVAVIAGSRPIWDPNFTLGRRYGQRGWHVFWTYYGPIGIVVSVMLNVVLLAIGNGLESSEWYGTPPFIAAICIGFVSFAIPRTPMRQVGSGILVGIGLLPLSWIVFAVAILATPALVLYVVISVICWVLAKRAGTAPDASRERDLKQLETDDDTTERDSRPGT